MEILGTAVALAMLPFIDKWAARRLIRIRKRIEKKPDSWLKKILLAEVRPDTEAEQAIYRSE